LLEWFVTTPKTTGTINIEDFKYFQILDKPQDVCNYLKNHLLRLGIPLPDFECG